MTRTHRTRPIGRAVTALLLLSGVFAGCSEDGSDDIDPGLPSLTVTGSNSCGQNSAPIPTSAEQISAMTYTPIRLTVSGVDPGASNSLITSGSQIVLFTEPSETGGKGRFESNIGEEGLSGPLTLANKSVADNFVCTAPGVVNVRARIAEYQPAGGGDVIELTSLAARAFRVRCVSQVEFDLERGPDGPIDLGTDGGDMDVSDAGDGGTDGDVEVEEPIWTVTQIPIPADQREIGIRGSTGDRPDNIVIQFFVGEAGVPLSGAKVAFTTSVGVQDVTLEPPMVETGADGMATLTLIAGGTVGIVQVTATVEAGDRTQTEESQPITIRGGIPSMGSFQMTCEHRIVPGFSHRVQEGRYLLGAVPATTCTAQLADRFEGRVDLDTNVFFLTEAGSVNQSRTTDADGNAVTQHVITEPPPVDVEPIEYERALVTAFLDEENGYNPRDGLVTIIAVTRGEERFVDVDGDGIYDESKGDFQRPEDDLPEPYVDSNDNGEYDEGETFRDTNNDRSWTEGNGTWDASTEIWVATRVLWTGNHAVIDFRANCPNCDGAYAGCAEVGADFDMAIGSRLEMSPVVLDDNGNCLNARGEGLLSIDTPNGVDALGAEELDLGALGCFHDFIPEEPLGHDLDKEVVVFRVVNTLQSIPAEPTEADPNPLPTPGNSATVGFEVEYRGIDVNNREAVVTVVGGYSICR